MSTARHVLVYGHLNLNLLDGSATWLTSLAETLSHTDSMVHLALRAPVITDRLVRRVRGISNVVVHETDAMLSDTAAIERLETLAVQHDASILITRGRDFSERVSQSPVLSPILWSYVTDFGFPLTQMPADELAQMRRIAAGSHRLFLQTQETRDYIESIVPEAFGRTLLMTPTIPDSLFLPLEPKERAPELRMIYAGKFHPHWRTLEMLALPAQLESAGMSARLTMLGEKLQGDTPAWEEAMREGLRNSPGVHWGGGVPREEVTRQLAAHDVGLSWRTRELDGSLELSTKLLEYAAAGTPPVPNRTRAHEELLGADYPLFLDDDSVETVVEVLRRNTADLEPIRERAQTAARAYSSSATAKRLEGYFHRSEELTGARPPAGPIRVEAMGSSPYLLGREVASGSGARTQATPWPAPPAPADEPTPDVLVCDGATAAEAARRKAPGTRLAVRLGEGEHPPVDPELVDVFVWPSPTDIPQGLPEAKVASIPPSVDTVDLARPKLSDAAWCLGVVDVPGAMAHGGALLAFVSALAERDARFHVYLRDAFDWDDPAWADPQLVERCREFFRSLAEGPARDHVTVVAPGPDLAPWLRGIGWVLTASATAHPDEMAAAASGAVPLPLSDLAEDVSPAVERVAALAASPDQFVAACEASSSQQPDIRTTREAWAALVSRLLPGERHHPTLRREPAAKPISVILPCYQSIDWMPQCLTCFTEQTLAPEFFELVLVFNGPDDGAADYAREFLTTAGMNFQLLHSDPGASTARNLGTRHAVGDWHTFVDVDDLITPNYLEALWDAAGRPDVVPLATMVDVREDGTSRPSAAHSQIIAECGIVDPSWCWRPMSITVLKLLPARVTQKYPFDPALRSGEDVALFFSMFEYEGLVYDTTPAHRGAVYQRLIRQGSVSRQKSSYDFMVSQRLQVMQALEKPFRQGWPRLGKVIDIMIRSQADMVAAYMRRHSDQYDELAAEVEERGLRRFPWDKIARPTERLVIAYAFAPYNDPSTLVSLKRMIAVGGPHNVISADMGDRRKADSTVAVLAQGVVSEHRVVTGPTAWDEWEGIEHFLAEGLAAFADIEDGQPPQRHMYSRAMWAPSHLLAGLIKARRPEIHWVAEFSDPLRRNVLGGERPGPIDDTAIGQELRQVLREAGHPLPDDASVFHAAEHIAYALADELVFTNPHQLTYMLSYLEDPGLAERVRELASVQPQPTLPPEFYAMGRKPAPLAPEQVHLGYFGSFYANRGMGDVLNGLARLDPAEAARLKVHVFTPSMDALARALSGHPNRGRVVAYHPLAYLDFLRAAGTFDALVVNDADTSAKGLALNPYLPSKLSDYLGAGAPIWAIAEPGSMLSRTNTAHHSRLGDAEDAARVLRALLSLKQEETP